MRHELKTDPEVFNATFEGNRNYEIRFDDRDFTLMDELILRETRFTGEEMSQGKPLIYTGSTIKAWVTHILRDPVYGLKEGWVIMAIEVREKRLQ